MLSNIHACPYKVSTVLKLFAKYPLFFNRSFNKTMYTFSTLKASFSTALLSGERFITQFELKIIKSTKSILLDVDARKPHVILKLIKEV